MMQIDSPLLNLLNYCEGQNHKGWDPFDGLNSKLFQSSPFKRSRIARLCWIQFFKLSPINLRKIFAVPKGYNSKGLALFINGYCSLYWYAIYSNDNQFGSPEKLKEKITDLAYVLLRHQNNGFSGSCWGYNFDWQNRVFFQPKNTPTVVVTSFCADALFDAYEVTGDENLKEHAISTSNFIINDLNRSHLDKNGAFIFSYSPLDNSAVLNASLLGARSLARSFSYSGNDELKELSHRALEFVMSKQASNGSWIYGLDRSQSWIDSFHTGFNLECIYEIQKYTNIDKFDKQIDLGLEYYIEKFFLKDGTPKYYHNKVYPVDIHSPAQLLVTLARLGIQDQNQELANNVVKWSVKNMQSDKGYFFYRRNKFFNNKISYIRWSQSWMFYALAKLKKNEINEHLD